MPRPDAARGSAAPPSTASRASRARRRLPASRGPRERPPEGWRTRRRRRDRHGDGPHPCGRPGAAPPGPRSRGGGRRTQKRAGGDVRRPPRASRRPECREPATRPAGAWRGRHFDPHAARLRARTLGLPRGARRRRAPDGRTAPEPRATCARARAASPRRPDPRVAEDVLRGQAPTGKGARQAFAGTATPGPGHLRHSFPDRGAAVPAERPSRPGRVAGVAAAGPCRASVPGRTVVLLPRGARVDAEGRFARMDEAPGVKTMDVPADGARPPARR